MKEAKSGAPAPWEKEWHEVNSRNMNQPLELTPLQRMRQGLPVKALLYLAYGDLKMKAEDPSAIEEFSKRQAEYLASMNDSEREQMILYVASVNQARRDEENKR